MRTDTSPTRNAGLLAAATTVVALMAVAAGGERVGPVDGRLATHDPAGQRVIAVMVAAARDLLLPEQTPARTPSLLGPEVIAPTSTPPATVVAIAPLPPPHPPLGDRWLDLPPPTC